MSLRLLTAAAVVLTATAAIGGCGRDSTPNQTPTQTAAVTIDDSPATGTIQVWAFNSEGEALAGLVEEFEKANPDVKVVVTPIPNDELPRKLEAALASGQVPDLVQPSTALPSYVAAGGILPVPEGLIDQAGFFPAAIELNTVDGTLYSVPWYVTAQVFAYNADLAAEAGVEPPATWDDVVAWAEALRSAGAANPLTTNADVENSWQALLTFIIQAGGTVYENGEFKLDSPEMLAACRHYASLFSSGASDASFLIELAETIVQFGSGEIGSMQVPSYLYNYLRQGAPTPETIAITTLPAGPANYGSYFGGSGLSVPAEAPNPDAAWKFARFLAEPASQAAFYEAGGVLPAARAAWEDPRLDSPGAPVFQEMLEASKAPPNIPTWTQIRSEISAVAEQLAHGVLTPEEAVVAMQAKAVEIGDGRQ
jgi:multiple sugar transport system substrate-binding protein